MSGVVFVETLRRHWIAMVCWAIGIALMAAYIIVIIPDMPTLQSYTKLVQGMPSALLGALGVSDAAQMATPAGFLGYGFFGWVMLVLAAYGVIYGLDITSNDEERGTMDVVLSLPIPRWRIVIEKFLAYTVAIVVIVLVSLVTLLWGISRSALMTSISASQVIQSSFNFIPATLLVMAFTAIVATLVRRRGLAIAIAAVFVVASWLIDTIGRAAPSTDGLRAFSFLKYYDSQGVIANGLVAVNVIGLLVVALILLGGTIWAFNRRDISV